MAGRPGLSPKAWTGREGVEFMARPSRQKSRRLGETAQRKVQECSWGPAAPAPMGGVPLLSQLPLGPPAKCSSGG